MDVRKPPFRPEFERRAGSGLGRAPLRGPGAPSDERESVWSTFLGLLPPDVAEALVGLVAAADPDQQPPDGEPWPALRLGTLPPAPGFPLHVLPSAARRLVAEAASAIGCDPSFPAVDVFAASAGAIGRSRGLNLGSNQFARASLFVAAVGAPGDGKSPAFGYATEPIRRLDNEFMEAFREAKARYREALKASKKGEGPSPPEPVPVRLGVDDTTVEALFRILAANRRGLLMMRDELSALLKGLGQYKGGGGSDRPNLLKIWSGQPFSIDRVLNEFGEPIHIPFPMLSIVGNMTPSSLPLMVLRERDDGLLDRWLFAFPDRLPTPNASERSRVANETLDDLAEVVRRLWMLEMEEAGGPHLRPKVVYLSNAGRDEVFRRYDEHVDQVNAADFPEALRGPWSKLEEYAVEALPRAGRAPLTPRTRRPTRSRSRWPTPRTPGMRGSWSTTSRPTTAGCGPTWRARGSAGAPEGPRGWSSAGSAITRGSSPSRRAS